MNRKVLAVGILALWIGALGWLLRREYFQSPTTLLADQPLNVSPGATYYRLALGGVQVGFQSMSVDTVADTVRVLDLMLLNLPVGGLGTRVEARTAANLTRTLDLRSFRSSMRGTDSRFDVQGSMAGDSVLALRLETASGGHGFNLPVRESLVLPALIPMRLAFGSQIALGRTYDIDAFDPLLLDRRSVRVRVVAESTFVVADSADQPEGQLEWIPARWDTVHAWHVIQESDGYAFEAWIDDLGQVVTASTPVGYSVERTAYEIAYENFGRGDSVPILTGGSNLIRQSAVAAGTAPSGSRLRALRLRLGDFDLAQLDLSGAGQRFTGNTLVVTTADPNTLRATYRLPNRDGALLRYRQPEPLIPIGDPRIEAQARQIIGNTRSPTRATESLVRWVSSQLDKRATAGLPSALAALTTLSGDANEHAALFVALARAVELPARTVSGLLYLDGRFYYHAWAEVYLGDWVPVDPTFGQVPADAAHIRLATGGLARQLELVRIVGQLSLDVVEAQTE